MINHGFNKLVDKRTGWPPSAPEFAGLCQLSADDFDFPTVEQAEKNISNFRRDRSTVLTPFEFTLYRRMAGDFYELRRMDSKRYWREVRRYYQEVERHAVNGGELLEQPVLVEEKKKPFVPASKEFAKSKIDEARSILTEVVSNEDI